MGGVPCGVHLRSPSIWGMPLHCISLIVPWMISDFRGKSEWIFASVTVQPSVVLDRIHPFVPILITDIQLWAVLGITSYDIAPDTWSRPSISATLVVVRLPIVSPGPFERRLHLIVLPGSISSICPARATVLVSRSLPNGPYGMMRPVAV